MHGLPSCYNSALALTRMLNKRTATEIIFHRALPVSFWSTPFRWVTLDICLHIQAEHTVTGLCIMPGRLEILVADDYCISHWFEYLCL